MANLAILKAALNAAIYQNTQNAITGEALNTILNSIIDTLGTGYRYAGVATPSANPGTIDNRVFYLATAAGTYTKFGAVQLDGKSLHIFIYDTTWHDVALDVPTTLALAVQQGSGTGSVVGLDPAAGATGAGSVCLGRTFGDGGELSANGAGSVVVGNAGTDDGKQSVAILQANEQGAAVSGSAYATNGSTANLAAEGEASHVEGMAAAAAEDSIIRAEGQGAHAEGFANNGTILADMDGAHAEGYSESGTIESSGLGSHAEGFADSGTIVASGDGSHAEGINTQASGPGSHAEGFITIAQNKAEHAEGKYNASHKKTTGTAAEQAAGTTLSSVGCGTGPNDRKNAVEVMQNGDVYVKGVGGYDGTNLNTANSIQKIAGCDYEENYDTFSTTEIPTFRWLMYRGLGRCGAIFTANQIAEIFTQISTRLSALQFNHEPSSIVVLDSFGLIAFDPTDPISLYAIDAYFYISFYDTDADEVHFGILKLEV